MGFRCRKLLHLHLHQHRHQHEYNFSPAPSPTPKIQPSLSLPLPITPRLPFLPIHDGGFRTHLLQVAMIAMACTFGIVMILCTVSLIRRKFYSRRHNNHNQGNMRGRNTPVLFYVNGDSPVSASEDDDDDDGRFIEHPIWFIRTVGLQQSVIDSIAVFTYKKDERLIDGTECSVCLGEFQEDESLRLLPKCSHAFHIPCIDTWLRSHRNCPLCRAPVVHDAGGGSGSGSGSTEVRVTEADSNASGENQETTEMGDFDSRVGNHHVGESESGVLRIGDDDAGVLLSSEGGGGSGETPDKMLPNFDKVNRHASISHEVEEEIQPMRRSVSMDSCTASMMFRDVVDLNSDQESSDAQLGDKINSSSKDVKIDKQGSGCSSSTICKLASIGRALQKRPISLRSSFSHNRKSSSSSGHCRSHSSTLPL